MGEVWGLVGTGWVFVVYGHQRSSRLKQARAHTHTHRHTHARTHTHTHTHRRSLQASDLVWNTGGLHVYRVLGR